MNSNSADLLNGLINNFSLPLVLMLFTGFTGIMWCLDKLIFSKKRSIAANNALLDFEKIHANLNSTPVDKSVDQSSNVLNLNELEQKKQALREQYLRRPWWLEYTAGFFGVVCMVFILRSFIAEPFRIPSASMMPTLQSGDLILVNKFSWGIRMPVFNKTIIDTGTPDRGDVMVFRFPPQPSVDFIKRVVALPGDTVEYNDKVLKINGQIMRKDNFKEVLDEIGDISNTKMSYVNYFVETLIKHDRTEKKHSIYNNPARSSRIEDGNLFTHINACTYLEQGIRCTVPKGHYFVMGDNRDNSQDSRWWGFVPADNIVGHAFFVWMNLELKFNRIGFIN